jgi:hypothetical protein
MPLPTSEHWPEIPYTALSDASLASGGVITGIGALRDFNRVERKVCAHLKMVGGIAIHSDGDPLINEPTIASRLIADELRPNQRQGSLRNGRAVIIPPVSLARMDVVFMGDLHIRGQLAGRLLREARYGLVSTNLYDERARYSGFLRRTLGPRTVIDETAENVQELTDESIAEAYKVARFALRHMYPGGLPELGR